MHASYTDNVTTVVFTADRVNGWQNVNGLFQSKTASPTFFFKSIGTIQDLHALHQAKFHVIKSEKQQVVDYGVADGLWEGLFEHKPDRPGDVFNDADTLPTFVKNWLQSGKASGQWTCNGTKLEWDTTAAQPMPTFAFANGWQICWHHGSVQLRDNARGIDVNGLEEMRYVKHTHPTLTLGLYRLQNLPDLRKLQLKFYDGKVKNNTSLDHHENAVWLRTINKNKGLVGCSDGAMLFFSPNSDTTHVLVSFQWPPYDTATREYKLDLSCSSLSEGFKLFSPLDRAQLEALIKVRLCTHHHSNMGD